MYVFEEDHPEFELNRDGSILERYDIKWETQSMSTVDVSKMDGQGVMALIMAAVRAERFCDGALKEFFENGSIEKWLCRLKEIDESGEYFVSKPMSNIELINGSCADQDVDVVVNAANNGLWAGGGICGVIFKKLLQCSIAKTLCPDCSHYQSHNTLPVHLRNIYCGHGLRLPFNIISF